jgi:hypothetical protein
MKNRPRRGRLKQQRKKRKIMKTRESTVKMTQQLLTPRVMDRKKTLNLMVSP